MITIDHGRTDSTDGAVFPYVFPLLMNPYSESSGIINFIGSRLGGDAKLAGKTIVVLYHGSPYGKRNGPDLQAARQQIRLHGASRSRCRHPGTEQESEWLTIRRTNPNYVVLRGWGVMNPVALKTAQKVGFPG